MELQNKESGVIVGEKTLRDYTKWMLIFYTLVFGTMYFTLEFKEVRSDVVAFISAVILVLNAIQFFKHKDTILYDYKMKEVIKKEPSLVYLAFAGLALGFLSDSTEPLILGILLSCGMLNLKYVIMHVQWENKIKNKKKQKANI